MGSVKRHKGIPDSWIRATEAGHRLGVNTCRIVCWCRLGYFSSYRKNLQTVYYCWEEMLRNKLVRQEFEKFQARLKEEENADLPRKRTKFKAPSKFEPEY